MIMLNDGNHVYCTFIKHHSVGYISVNELELRIVKQLYSIKCNITCYVAFV